MRRATAPAGGTSQTSFALPHAARTQGGTGGERTSFPAAGTKPATNSRGTAKRPLHPFGTLRLHPASPIVLGGGLLDPQGRAVLSIPVPPDPALVGFSLYWQAVVGPPLLFTNLEITTVPGFQRDPNVHGAHPTWT